MKLSPKLGLWVTTFVWIAVVGWLWGNNHYQLTHGKEILLRTAPVDPRDLFRGDYVVLRYEISTLNLDSLGTDLNYFRPNATVFVRLTEREGFWRAKSLALQTPETGVFLQGRVKRFWERTLEVEYGLESYFVPEGQGKEIERKHAEGNLAVVVSVSPHGKGLLKELRFLDN